MPLKFKAKSKDEIPAELHSLYVEREGAFVLDVEGGEGTAAELATQPLDAQILDPSREVLHLGDLAADRRSTHRLGWKGMDCPQPWSHGGAVAFRGQAGHACSERRF